MWEGIPLIARGDPAFRLHLVAAELAVQRDQLLARRRRGAVGWICPAECSRARDVFNAMATREHVLYRHRALWHRGHAVGEPTRKLRL
eukprot:scaffold10191_cov108-Isochrysis_galbana.AAC.12